MLTTVVSGPKYRSQLRRELRQPVRLHPKKNNIHRPHFFEGTGDGGPSHEISLAAFHLHTALLHGAQVWATREERDIESGLCHARTDVRSDSPRSRDQESHRWSFIGDHP